MPEQTTQFIPGRDEMMIALGLSALPEEQKNQIFAGLVQHFTEIIIETFADSISEDQAQQIEQLLKKDLTAAQNRIGELAERSPGLYDKIRLELAQEIETLRSSYEKI